MEQSLNKQNNIDVEGIVNEDWPLLKELETTRFSLKNKKNADKINNTLQILKEDSEKEDLLISEQSLEDEKLVDAFLGNKSSNLNMQQIPSEELNNNVNFSAVAQETQQQIVSQPQVVVTPVSQVNVNQNNFNNNNQQEDMSKLVAKGMAKVYIEKTDSILSPLQFLVSHAKQISVGLLQFVVPALITWYLINHIELIKGVLSKESDNMQYLYIVVFYFACLFVSITGQVTFSGLVNMFGITFKNLAKEAKK